MSEYSSDVALAALAARVYEYRLLHILFGSEPTYEELELLTNDDAIQVSEALAAVGYPTSSLFSRLTESVQNTSGNAAVERLRDWYTRLFIVPGDTYVKPWESVYVGKNDVLFTEVTLDVRNRYEALGFKAQEKGHFPEDHLSMMFDFMAGVSQRIYENAAAGNVAEAQNLVYAQGCFAQNHLVNWLPLFKEKLEEKDKTGFFAACASMAEAFVTADVACAKEVLAAARANEVMCA
jgi:TorA maturation chaperone TorD